MPKLTRKRRCFRKKTLKQKSVRHFYGAMLSKKSAMMHMGRYVAGLGRRRLATWSRYSSRMLR